MSKSRVYVYENGFKFYCRRCRKWHKNDYGNGLTSFECGICIGVISAASPNSYYYAGRGWTGLYVDDITVY